MADDKKKDENEDGKKKKKGLPAIVMIAIGAIAGGAGVVFAVPPKTVVKEAPPRVFEDVFITHPDVIKKEFNPRQRAGKGVARVSFKFVYKVHQERGTDAVQKAAFELIKENWDKANSTALELFRSRSIAEFNSDNGTALLKHDLMEGLNKTFFAGENPVAQVTDVMWIDWLMQ